MKNFSSEFWKDFVKTNNDFSETCVIKDAIAPVMLDDLNEGIMELLRNRFQTKDVDQGFRVYIEGIEQKDQYLKDLCNNPPLENEDITSYTSRVFDKKFGFIINSGERHSDLIAKNILESVNPLVDLKGLPPLGLEITIFIGNYGWTPLGIHQDHRGENVIHYHLGPANKQMYVWDEEKYDELTGSKSNNKNIEPILPHAKEFDFGAGDLYYMPWNKYHVGKTDELSVGITLWFNNPSKYKYFSKIIDSLSVQFVKKEKEIISNKFNLIEENENCSKDIFEILELDKGVLNNSVTDFFNFLTSEFNHNLISNGGWQTVPMSQQEKASFTVDSDYETLSDKQILADSKFKILHKINDEQLLVYVRGSKFQMQYYPVLIDIINDINKNEVIDLNKYLSPEKQNIPKEAILYFLALIYDKRGFELVQ